MYKCTTCEAIPGSIEGHASWCDKSVEARMSTEREIPAATAEDLSTDLEATYFGTGQQTRPRTIFELSLILLAAHYKREADELKVFNATFEAWKGCPATCPEEIPAADAELLAVFDEWGELWWKLARGMPSHMRDPMECLRNALQIAVHYKRETIRVPQLEKGYDELRSICDRQNAKLQELMDSLESYKREAERAERTIVAMKADIHLLAEAGRKQGLEEAANMWDRLADFRRLDRAWDAHLIAKHVAANHDVGTHHECCITDDMKQQEVSWAEIRSRIEWDGK
jgi:hypothetical protein